MAVYPEAFWESVTGVCLTSIQIRDATLADIPALPALFLEVDRLHWEQQPDVFREVPGPTREAVYLRSLITDWKTAVIVAEIGAILVGCLVIRIQETPEIPILVPQRYAMVDTIVVAQAYQSKGLGKQMMVYAEEWVRARDIERIELNVFEFNTGAHRFYEDLGYGTLSRRMVRRLGNE